MKGILDTLGQTWMIIIIMHLIAHPLEWAVPFNNCSVTWAEASVRAEHIWLDATGIGQ